MAMNIADIDFTGDRDMIKTALIGLAAYQEQKKNATSKLP